MSKIQSAISEINRLDIMSARDTWLNRIHPLAKFIVTIVFIVVTVSFDKYDLAGVLLMGIYLIVLFMFGDISFFDSLKRLKLILPIVCLMGVFNPIFDRTVIVEIGTVGISGGVISMLTLILKGVYTVLASYLLIASTSIEKICYAMRLIKIPGILVTQIMLTYRYISLLLGEAGRVTQAYSLRAPGQNGVHFKAWGSLAGKLLLRSMDRATDVYESMTLRGFNGNYYYGKNKKIGSKDLIYLVSFVSLSLALRFLL